MWTEVADVNARAKVIMERLFRRHGYDKKTVEDLRLIGLYIEMLEAIKEGVVEGKRREQKAIEKIEKGWWTDVRGLLPVMLAQVGTVLGTEKGIPLTDPWEG